MERSEQFSSSNQPCGTESRTKKECVSVFVFYYHSHSFHNYYFDYPLRMYNPTVCCLAYAAWNLKASERYVLCGVDCSPLWCRLYVWKRDSTAPAFV